MQLAGFVICGLHLYVWLSVKHELCNQVHMWERLRGETEIYRQVQPLFKPSEGFKYEHFWAFYFFFCQEVTSSAIPAWHERSMSLLFWGIIAHRNNCARCGVFVSACWRNK